MDTLELLIVSCVCVCVCVFYEYEARAVSPPHIPNS